MPSGRTFAVALSVALTVALVADACESNAPSTSTPAATASAPLQASSTPGVSAPSSAASASPASADDVLYDAHYRAEPGRSGGSVVVSDWQAVTQLNPYFSNGVTNFEVMAATMRTLLSVTADGHYRPELSAGPITQEGNVTPDPSGRGFTVRVTLRPGLAWSDGQPLTADDIAFTWKWITDPSQDGISTLGWEEVDDVRVIDASTADIHFKEPFSGWLGTVGSNAILPRHYVSKFPIKAANSGPYPVSAGIGKAVTVGPFKYVTASANAIELARDANWTGPADACAGACLDRIVFQTYPGNKDGEIAAFKSGETDVTLNLNQGDAQAFADVDASAGRTIIQPSWLYEHLDMNLSGAGPGKGHPALKDIRVRTAIEQAIDKSALYQAVFPGSSAPQPACTNAAPSNYWALQDATCPAFDPAAANARLDAAGYARGVDGIRVDPTSHKPLVFENCTFPGYRVTQAEFIARSLQAIGIRLGLHTVDANSVLFAGWPDVAADTPCNLAHGTYDLAEFAYLLSFDLFGDYYYSYHSSQIPTASNKGNGYNTIRVSDPAMDAAIDGLKAAVSPSEQLAAVRRVQQVYVNLVPEIALYYRNDLRAINPRLHNFAMNPSTSTDLWNVQDWWLEP